jgi:uncharacterized protein
MKITVLVKTRARNVEVAKYGEGKYFVSVTKAPVDGEANSAVIEALSDFFKVPKSNISLLVGLKSPQKIFEILGL